MKLNKLISFILSLTIIISTMAGITMVNAAEVTNDGFENTAVNGSFNDILGGTWTVHDSSKGELEIVDDTKDTSESNKNGVLRYTGNTSGSYSLIYYNGLTKGKTYYMSLKVRVATEEGYAPSGNMFLYAAALSDVAKSYYPKSRPQISQDDWAICSGVFTATAERTWFKIINDQEKATATASNVKDAIYEIDDFVLYDLEGSKYITNSDGKALPDGVSVVSGGVTSNIKVSETEYYNRTYAKPGSSVVLKYEIANKVLSSTNVTIEKNDVEYSFIMPNENVAVTLADPPAFTNLIANGDMENTELAHKWVKGGNAVGAEITIEKESNTSDNHVLKFNGTGITENKNANPMSYMAYADKLKAGKYYFSYKIRQSEGDANTGKLYAYNSLYNTGSGNLNRPQISTSWATRSGIYTLSGESSSFSFKIISEQGTAGTNVPNVIYELDNVIVYDFTDVYKVELPAKTRIIEGGKRVDITDTNLRQVPTYYAKAGETVKLEYTGMEELSIAGIEMTADGNIYTFTMPSSDVTVAEVADITFNETVPSITAATPRNFVIIAAKYNDESLTEVYTANCVTTTDNQNVLLSEIEEFSNITDWTNVHIFVWKSLTDIVPLCDTFICTPEA